MSTPPLEEIRSNSFIDRNKEIKEDVIKNQMEQNIEFTKLRGDELKGLEEDFGTVKEEGSGFVSAAKKFKEKKERENKKFYIIILSIVIFLIVFLIMFAFIDKIILYFNENFLNNIWK